MKVRFVAMGYVAAFLVASLAVAVRVASTSGPEAQASSGMHAFGDAYLFLGVFTLMALVPTGAMLFFLRTNERFWNVLSAVAIAVALTGVAAAAAWAQWSPLRILLAPLDAAVFLACAVLAPRNGHRMALGAATLMEAAVCAYAAWRWFGPIH